MSIAEASTPITNASRPATRSPSPEEMRRLEGDAGVEFVDGHLVEQTVSAESVRIGGNIVTKLNNANLEKSVRVYQDGLSYQCFADAPKKYRQPDASVITKARLAEAGIVGDIGIMPIAPDLAVEVVSPGDSANTLRRKLDEYRAAGFGQVWLVYPELHGVHLWRADGYVADLNGEDEITAGPLLPAFRCKVSELFED